MFFPEPPVRKSENKDSTGCSKHKQNKAIVHFNTDRFPEFPEIVRLLSFHYKN
jgi:hypothetical protein